MIIGASNGWPAATKVRRVPEPFELKLAANSAGRWLIWLVSVPASLSEWAPAGEFEANFHHRMHHHQLQLSSKQVIRN